MGNSGVWQSPRHGTWRVMQSCDKEKLFLRVFAQDVLDGKKTHEGFEIKESMYILENKRAAQAVWWCENKNRCLAADMNTVNWYLAKLDMYNAWDEVCEKVD